MENRRRRDGFALGVVLLVLTLLATFAAVTGGLGATTLHNVRESERQTALQQGANGGLHELMDALYANESYSADGFGSYLSTSGPVAYRWTFDSTLGRPYCVNNLASTAPATGWNGMVVPAGTAALLVTATQPGFSEKELGVGAIVVNDFPYAVVADGVLKIGDVAAADGVLEANVRSNLEGGNPNINGDVVDGQSFSRDGPGSIRVDGTGIRNYDEPPLPLPNLPISGIVDSFSEGGVRGQHPHGGPADYRFHGNVQAETDSAGHVAIEGETIAPDHTVYVKGDLLFSKSATLASGIHFFVDGNIRVNGALTQLPPTGTTGEALRAPGQRFAAGLSADNSFMVCTGRITLNGGSATSMHLLAEEEIRQNGSSDWRGLVYVQDGGLTMNGTQAFEGVAIARSGALRGDILAGNTDVLYDPNVIRELAGLNLGISGFVRPRSWWLF